MEHYYVIEADMKILNGWSNFCTFKIGEDKELAAEIWKQMACDKLGLLRLSLIEVGDAMEVIGTRMCTLITFEKNSRLIAKEIFKANNFSGTA
ncbi:hypothetical protein FHW36_106443 [Chitinophaga polysaccharea]|uniref:Uncharacterized protein n=1 Tax=Chitinophaga polysaccharea TaxID=1293035 RepID=A0A561PM82_9BACT|nr:hypothetical protein [Chitinophaga polysaccharea]TWF39211.1 hypothetical protein FHW36_106443 [Chitinophaga polysaccharea]